jgi:predicted O-methyltransferase YrrM
MIKRTLSTVLAYLLSPILTRQLAKSEEFSFTQDYAAGFVDQWREYLAEFAGRSGLSMLEIGSFEGRSATWFLSNILTHSTARLVCIDPFYNHLPELRFEHNIRLTGARHKVRTIKDSSAMILPDLEPESFDIIYVDGSHLAPDVMFDAMMSWELLKPGGMLIFDDYKWEEQRPLGLRPRLAIDLFLDSHSGQYQLIHKDYQVAVRKIADKAAK